MMEKIGIEIEEPSTEKTAAEVCLHPKESLIEEDGERFCKKCGKYLRSGK
jgi:hypothetical protein